MWTKAWVLLVIILALMAAPTLAQTATPTPTPTQIAITANIQLTLPRSDMYRSVATAAAQVNQLPEQIQAAGQNGQSIIPDTAGATQMFGYIKWLFSLNTAQELMGKTLAPFGVNVFIIFTLITVMTALYFLVNFIVLIVKGIIWVINQVLKLIPFW